MVIVHNTDMHKYNDNQRRVEIIKYSNGVNKIYEGQAIYLPWRLYNGDGLFDNIEKIVSDNKDTISNISNVAGTVAAAIGKIGTNTIDVVIKVKELKSKQPAITNDAINKVLNATDTAKTGIGFFHI